MESELTLLAHSEVPESSEGKGALVMKLKQNLITQLKTLLFNNTSDIGGGEQVRTLFNKFHDTVYKVGERIVPINSLIIDLLRVVGSFGAAHKPHDQRYNIDKGKRYSWKVFMFLIRKSKPFVLICRFGRSVLTNFVASYSKEQWKGGVRSFV